MSFNIIQGTTGYLQPAIAAVDQGWTISGGYALHTSCNAGKISSITSLGLIVGRQYTFNYTVDQYTSGEVNILCGATAGASRTANGTYTETLTCTTIAELFFYSNGGLRLSELMFYDTILGPVAGTTISFNPKNNQWGCEYSYQQEVYIRFKNQFYSLKNGGLWQHNVNPVRNNFNGVQYVSEIQLYANIDPTNVKLWWSMRVQSNRVWYCKNYGDLLILPVEERPAGMSSRLTKNRYKNYQGSYFADFLRNILDPRFTGTQVAALFNAEPLRGRVMEVLLTNDDTIEVVLFEVDFKSSPSAYTY